MNIENLKESLSQSQPPEGLSKLLQALWYDAKDNWSAAHEIAQDTTSNEASWIHAYLHRKERDAVNALYWYRKAGKSMPEFSLKEEWEMIAKEILKAES